MARGVFEKRAIKHVRGRENPRGERVIGTLSTTMY